MFYAERGTHGDHDVASGVMEPEPAAVSTVVEPEESLRPPHDQSIAAVCAIRAAMCAIMEPEPAAASTIVESEQSSEPPCDQPRAAMEPKPAVVSTVAESSEPPGVQSAVIETKRFYSGNKPKRPRVADKLDIGLSSDAGSRCGRKRKIPSRYLETV